MPTFPGKLPGRSFLSDIQSEKHPSAVECIEGGDLNLRCVIFSGATK